MCINELFRCCWKRKCPRRRANNGGDAAKLLSLADGVDSPHVSPDSVSLASLDDRRFSSCHISSGTNPQLQCIVVPSYGKSPPSNVAEKIKIKGDKFLRGVGDDLTIIQTLIAQDPGKELVQVRIMCHFEQVTVARFLKMIEDKMKDLKLRHRGSSQKGCKCTSYDIKMML